MKPDKKLLTDLVVALANLVADWERVHGPIPEDHEAKAALWAAKGGGK